jgi:NAD(P)-dependent dehydrogenase (short-subunit alcohol dehydrogenase family)
MKDHTMGRSCVGAIVLITGANGGLGQEFVAQALARGAHKVYATARTAREWHDPRVVPLILDVTDPASVAEAAQIASDTTHVINNAGVAFEGELATQSSAEVRRMFETNFFGALNVVNAFAPVLERNGGGVLLNVLSALSWLSGVANAYSASKAALWSATNSLRLELAPRGTLVVGLHLGATDTPMTAFLDVEKGLPSDVVAAAFDGIEAGQFEVLADETSVAVKRSLSGAIEAMYPQLVAAPAEVVAASPQLVTA